MAIWSNEIKEIERLQGSYKDQLPDLEKELTQLVKSDDPNVLMLYSRRCLEVIISDLCERELKRPRKTEPLKGIIDKLKKEDKVLAHIITSMDHVNSLSSYGAHPKDFDPEQVKPVLNNLAIVIKWYLKYKAIEIPSKQILVEEKTEIIDVREQVSDMSKLEKSVAILPFKNDSSDEENIYFINGLMEEVLNNLQKIKALRVISRTSVERYRNQTKSIPEIAKELGVNYIVEGSGQKYGNAFRLRTQLIMAAKENHLWGESYQQEINEVKDIFNIQSQIAEAITKELNAIITPQERDLIEKIPTTELSAYDAYLKGQFNARKLSKNNLDTAMQYFELAKVKDPKYALAYAGICNIWLGRQQLGIASPAEAGPKAFEAAVKALELDSACPEIHYSLALLNTWGMWNWEEGEKEFKKTIELNPNHAEAHAYYSQLSIILGRLEAAIEGIELSLTLDPINPLLKMLHGLVLLTLHRYDDVIIKLSELLKQEPSNIGTLWTLTYAFHFTERFNDALENWMKAARLLHDEEIILNFNEGHAKAGYCGAMKNGADFLVRLSKTTYVNPIEIAFGYIMAGDNELALEWTEHAYEEHNPNVTYLLHPMFDPLRNEFRFQEIARKMNLPYKFD